MSAREAVCAIVPAYNAADTVGAVVRGALRHLDTVIVADDGSGDGTAAAARQAGAAVIALPENRGKGNALRVLFAEARGRGFAAVVALDADGQHDPDDIPAFLAAHRENPGAVVTGSRLGDGAAIPPHRHNSMLVARFYISIAANQFVEDTQCGFRLYPLDVVDSMALLKERYVTETELLIKAGDSGRKIVSLPIRAHYPPGFRTHFRSVPDVAAISVYVISYIMVKWWLEAARPGKSDTYRGGGTGRDVFCLSPRADRLFEVATLLAAMPLSVLYGAWFYAARLAGVRAFRGLEGCGASPGRVFVSTMLLPLLLAASIVDLAGNRLGVRPDLTTGFVRRFYTSLAD